MLSFVVVATKPGRRIPPEVLALLRDADSSDLCFVPDDHVFWTDESERVAFAGWQAGTAFLGVGSHWHTSARGLTAFTGRLWPKGSMWRADGTWASQLERYWQDHRIVETRQQFDGIYAAVSLAPSGDGLIATDPLSIALLYRAETDDFIAFSSAPSLAARVAAPPGQQPDRDPLGAAWLPFLGYAIGDRTGFVGTSVLPSGSYVDISEAWGSRVCFSSATPWAAAGLPSSERELIDLVQRDLIDSLRSVAQLPADRRFADITGGKDSRLILALMLQEGMTDRFTFRTIGLDYMPDAIIGTEIAARFGLQHERIEPPPMDHTVFERRLGTHVFHTSGMFNAVDLKGLLLTPTWPSVSGVCGETLRTNFKGYPLLSSVAELRDQFHRRANVDALSILQPDVRSQHLGVINAELCERVDAGGSTPQDLLDSFYVRQRIRRWFGAAEELGDSGRTFPLYSLLGLQAAFALGPAKRRNELLHFVITRNACPELAKLPFANAGWSEALLSQLSDADEYRVAAEQYTGPAPVQWQAIRLEENRAVLEGYLLDDRSSPIFDILDRKAAIRVLRRPLPTDVQALIQLYGALTAAVWLGRHETRSRFGEPPRQHRAINQPPKLGASGKRRSSVLLGRIGRRSARFLRERR